MADLMMCSVSNSVQYTRQDILHKIRYSAQELNHLKPRSQRLISSVATKGNRKTSNLGYQQIDVCLLRVVSDVVVDIIIVTELSQDFDLDIVQVLNRMVS